MTRRALGRTVALCVLGILVASCATTLSPMQKRQITTRLLDATYEDAYRATMTVLQDHGYTIRNTDMESGLVSGYAFRQSDDTKGYEVSCVLDPRSESKTELRITIRREKSGEESWISGLFGSSSPDVYDPNVYNGLFTEISVEVRRIEASR